MMRKGACAYKCVGVFLCFAVLVLAGPSRLRAQGETQFAHDNHAFRFILDQMQLTPLADLESATQDPEHTILIVFGETEPLAKISGGLRNFITQGGALLVATDRATASVLKTELAIRVLGQQVLVDPDSDSAYRGRADCPFVKPLALDPPIFLGLSRVATNRPSVLLGGPFHVLANFPADCIVPGSRLGSIGLRLGGFAAGGELGKGRVLALSDHSVFINEMMLQGDNQNFDLAYNCLDWLRDGTKRKQALFMDEGTVVQDFAVPINLSGIMPEFTVDLCDRVAAAVEDDDLIGRALEEMYDSRQYYSGMAIALTVVFALYGFHRLTKARRPELDLPGPGEMAGSAGTWQEEHWQSLVQADHAQGTARQLARQWFMEHGLAPTTGAQPPPITVHAGWRRGRIWRDTLQTWWRLAQSEEPPSVTTRQLARLVRRLADIEEAHWQGQWHFHHEQETA
jgi:hypothetical protein